MLTRRESRWIPSNGRRPMIKINTYPPLKKINIDSFGKMAVLSRGIGFYAIFCCEKIKRQKKDGRLQGDKKADIIKKQWKNTR